MTGSAHSNGATTPVEADPALIAEQRRRARRGALLLGMVALLTYIGFIVATSLRH